jgi:hypothetical protein
MLQFVAIVIGAFGVEVGIRRDVGSRMIESHRLMPAPPVGSILGYVVGTPMFAIGLMLVNFVLGLVCCQIAGLPFDDWVNANGLLLLFAFMAYSLIAQFAFVMPGSSVLLFFGAMVTIANAASGTNLCPSISVLIFPILSRTSPIAQLFGAGRSSVPGAGIGYVTAIGGQLLIAAVAIRVAVRRYTTARVIGITPAMGLILLTVWASLAAADFLLPEAFSYGRYIGRYSSDDLTAQIVLAIGTSLLVALLPIASSALSRQRELTRSAQIWTPVLAGAMICALLMLAPKDNIDPTVVSTFQLQSCSVIVAFVTGTACLFNAGYQLRRRAWIYVVFWVTLTWIVPIIADAVYRGINSDPVNATVITSFSPPGALALMWNGSAVPVQPGVIGQLLIAMLPVGLVLVTRLRAKSAARTSG